MANDPERHSRVLKMLHDEKLDALICSSPTAVLLLTGYWPVMGVSVALFTSSGDVHVILPGDENEIAVNSTRAALINFCPETLDTLTTPRDAVHDPLVALCEQLSLGQARVGMAIGQNMQPATYAVTANYESSLKDILQHCFPNIQIVASDTQLEILKASKTAVELAHLTVAVSISEAGFAAASEAIKPGLREAEIAGTVQFAFEKAPAAQAIQRSYGFFYCMSGPNSAKAWAAYARTRQREVKTGDLVMIHANTCGDGYWTDITRTYTVGEPQDQHIRMRTAIMEARQAALDVIKPGVQAAHVDKVARNVLQQHGYGKHFRHALGHGVGFAAANGNGRPRIHPASPDILEDGMTFNIEPAIYFDDYGGMRHCDVVAVTSSGVEVLTRF